MLKEIARRFASALPDDRASLHSGGGQADGTKLIAENRRARRDYELIERVEAGVVLTGTEVKSARDGHVQLGQAYADVRDGEAWLIGASISEYAQGGPLGHQPDRDRKLLLHRGRSTRSTGRCARKASRSSRRGCTSRTAA